MYRFEKLLVNLSLTEADIPTLKLASKIAQLACSRSVTFIHAREAVEIPEPLKRDYPWLIAPIEEASRLRAESFVRDFFKAGGDCQTEILMENRNPATALLEISLNRDTDLIVIGDFHLDRSLAIKLARKAPCSILLAPAECSGDFSKICLALDLSKYSEYVLDSAVAFASAHEMGEIDCVNFYAIPEGFHKTNLPREKFQEELKTLSEDRLRSFVSAYELKGINVNPLAVNSPIPGSTLLSLAEDNGYDLLVIGCRGKDALTAALLGSNAEDVLRGSKKSAVLAVKEKGTGKSFLQSLLNLSSASA